MICGDPTLVILFNDPAPIRGLLQMRKVTRRRSANLFFTLAKGKKPIGQRNDH